MLNVNIYILYFEIPYSMLLMLVDRLVVKSLSNLKFQNKIYTYKIGSKKYIDGVQAKHKKCVAIEFTNFYKFQL